MRASLLNYHRAATDFAPFLKRYSLRIPHMEHSYEQHVFIVRHGPAKRCADAGTARMQALIPPSTSTPGLPDDRLRSFRGTPGRLLPEVSRGSRRASRNAMATKAPTAVMGQRPVARLVMLTRRRSAASSSREIGRALPARACRPHACAETAARRAGSRSGPRGARRPCRHRHARPPRRRDAGSACGRCRIDPLCGNAAGSRFAAPMHERQIRARRRGARRRSRSGTLTRRLPSWFGTLEAQAFLDAGLDQLRLRAKPLELTAMAHQQLEAVADQVASSSRGRR